MKIDFFLSCILHILINAFKSYATFPPSFINQPQKGEVLFKSGSTIKLPCQAKAFPNPTYEWLKNDYPIENLMISKDDGSLIIEKALKENEGQYQCSVYNNYGRAISHISVLKMAYINSYSAHTERVIDVFLGASAILECDKPTSYPPPVIQWFYIEDLMKIQSFEEDYRRVLDNKGNLHITKIIDDDNDKVYTCVSFNSFLKTMTRGANTRIKIKQSSNNLFQQPHTPLILLYHSVTNNTVLRNNTLIISCIFSRGGVLWKRNSQIISDSWKSNRIRIIRQSTTLEIKNIKVSDSGNYKCIPDNSNNELAINFHVSVVYKPSFIKIPQDTTVALNETHVFECSAEGLPIPRIRWSANGQSIRRVLDGNRIYLKRNKLYMKFLSSKDIFVLQCNASNEYGYVFQNAFINVWDKKPLIQSNPSKYLKGILKNNLNVTCNAFSAPPPKLHWKKDSYKLNIQYNNKYSMDQYGNLLIKNLNSNDAGVYECMAVNVFGASKIESTVVIRQPTVIVDFSKDTKKQVHSDIKLECAAETDRLESQNLKIHWYYQPIADMNSPTNIGRSLLKTSKSDAATFLKSELKLESVTPKNSGIYICNATNKLDYDIRKIRVIIEDVPEPPLSISVDCDKLSLKRKAILTWVNGFHNNNPITSYVIEFRTQFDPKHWFQIGPISIAQINAGPSYTIDIQPYQNYKFRIRSSNKLGISQPSGITTSKCKLNQTNPNRNPSNIFVYGTKPNTLKIKWKPVPYLYHNGPNMSYHFIVRCFNCDAVTQFVQYQFTLNDWSNSSIELSSFTTNSKTVSIETYKRYGVKIQSKNSEGYCTNLPKEKYGYSGENFPTIKPDKPNVIEVTSNSVTLSWQVLYKEQLPDIHGFFRGYRIEWCLNRNLTQEICERNKKHQDEILFKPDEKELKHRLELGDNNMFNLDQRLRKRQVTDQDYVYMSNKFMGNICNTKLTGLTGLSEIRLWTRIINIQYAGPRSEIVTFNTHEGTPGPVTDFNGENVEINYVELTWAQPILTNGKLVGYDIEVRRALNNGAYGPILKTVHIRDSMQIRTRISSLRPATTYIISIWALTKPGRGKEKQIKATTRQENKETNLVKLHITQLVSNSYNITVLFTPKIKALLSIGDNKQTASSTSGSWLFYVQFRLTQNVIWEETEKQYSRWWILITNLEQDKSYVIRTVINTAKGSIVTKSQVIKTSQSQINAFSMLRGSGTTWFIILLILIFGLLCGIVGLFVWRRKKILYLRGKHTPSSISENQHLNHSENVNHATNLYDRYTSFVNHSSVNNMPPLDHDHNPSIMATDNQLPFSINEVIPNSTHCRKLNSNIINIECLPGQTIENSSLYDKYPFYLKDHENPLVGGAAYNITTIPKQLYNNPPDIHQSSVPSHSTPPTTYFNYTSSSSSPKLPPHNIYPKTQHQHLSKSPRSHHRNDNTNIPIINTSVTMEPGFHENSNSVTIDNSSIGYYEASFSVPRDNRSGNNVGHVSTSFV